MVQPGVFWTWFLLIYDWTCISVAGLIFISLRLPSATGSGQPWRYQITLIAEPRSGVFAVHRFDIYAIEINGVSKMSYKDGKRQIHDKKNDEANITLILLLLPIFIFLRHFWKNITYQVRNGTLSDHPIAWLLTNYSYPVDHDFSGETNHTKGYVYRLVCAVDY